MYFIDIHDIWSLPAYFVRSTFITHSHFMTLLHGLCTWKLLVFKDLHWQAVLWISFTMSLFMPAWYNVFIKVWKQALLGVFNKDSLNFVSIEKISKLKNSHVYILQICRLAAACGGIKPAVCLGQTPVMQHSAACSRTLDSSAALRESLGWPGHSRVMQHTAALCRTRLLVSTCHSHQPQPQVMWGEVNFVVWCQSF